MVVQDTTQHDRASQKLTEIAAEIAACQKCPLAATRTQTVPGEGSPTAEIMFVGEGPGRDEDQSGRPFVGRAGKFLDELIESLPMRREDVYIANVVKCRPPGNRDPERQEVEQCSGYLTDQIETIDPLVIVPLGRHALGWFVSNPRITADHGKIMRQENRVLMPLLHPSAGLRSTKNARRLREGIHNIKDALLESIRIRQASLMASKQTDEESDEVITRETVAATFSPEPADENNSSEQSKAAPAEPPTRLFERSQTTEEIQTEIRRQRELEEAEAASEAEAEKLVVDDRQASFF